jgi:hypothetical protein
VDISEEKVDAKEWFLQDLKKIEKYDLIQNKFKKIRINIKIYQ